MGMFDYFRSSFDLGPEFTNTECQTKDFDSFCGGSMSNYWLDPHGYLYYVDYRGTHIFTEIAETDPEYSKARRFLNFKYLPTGDKGKVTPFMFTGFVRVYPSQWDDSSNNWPEMGIYFKYGRVVDHERIQAKSY